MSYIAPKFRKLAKPKACLVIGNVQLGFDEGILKTLSNYAKTYNAQVYHLGHICSDLEKIMYERRLGKIRTFEKNYIQKVDSYDKAAARFEKKNAIAEYNQIVGYWQRAEKNAEVERSRLENEVESLVSAEQLRVKKLIEYFPNIKFVINKEQRLVEDHLQGREIGSNLKLSKYLSLQSIMANGPKVATQPITDRAFAYMKSLKTSVICPHPTPAMRPFNREGLNQSWEIYTTGGLQYQDEANRPSDFHRAVNAPAAMMIFIDQKNGEYHPKRVHFDVVSCKVGKNLRPAILDDGRVFTSATTWETASSDNASATTDLHAPFEHRGVVGCSRFITEIHKAETFIDDGDTVDNIGTCPHNVNAPLHSEGLRYLDDEKAFARITKALTDNPRIKTKVLIPSNHANWPQRMVEKLPFLQGMLDLASIYKRVIPDWIAHIPKPGEDYTYYFGDLAFKHGHENNGSLTSAAKVWLKVFLGHWHIKSSIGRADTCGAGAMLGPGYIQGNTTAWTNSVASITRYQGKTAVNIKAVLHSETRRVSRVEYRGDIYEVDYHKYAGE